jgi:DNA recombination protein RmuC
VDFVNSDPILAITLLGGLTALIAAVLLTWGNGLKKRLDELTRTGEISVQALDAELDQLRREVQDLRVEHATQQSLLASEQGAHLQARETINTITAERNTLSQNLSEAEKQCAVLRTELQKNIESHEERMRDLELMKKQAIEAANAGALDSANKISSKLLDDHKRQSDEAKKESEKRVKETTETLVTQITEVGKTIHALNADVETNRGAMDTVMRALSSPGGAGQYSEIGLENTLTSFGLVKDRDFVIQQQVDGKRLRPDAMVFLPGSTVLVIDSKASKFLLDLAEAETEEAEGNAYASLGRTMNTHLKQLSDKNYKAEVISGYQATGREGTSPQVVSVMYLPNEGAIEKALIADPKFLHKAAKLQITVAGPAALACLIGFSRVQLDIERQSNNQERIVEGAQKIVESIGVIVDETVAVGKGLKSATQHYNKMTGSMNARLLPRIRQMTSFGVQSNRHKQIPDHVPTYSFTEHERGDLIEGEAEEIDTQSTLIDFSDEDEFKS